MARSVRMASQVISPCSLRRRCIRNRARARPDLDVRQGMPRASEIRVRLRSAIRPAGSVSFAQPVQSERTSPPRAMAGAGLVRVRTSNPSSLSCRGPLPSLRRRSVLHVFRDLEAPRRDRAPRSRSPRGAESFVSFLCFLLRVLARKPHDHVANLTAPLNRSTRSRTLPGRRGQRRPSFFAVSRISPRKKGHLREECPAPPTRPAAGSPGFPVPFPRRSAVAHVGPGRRASRAVLPAYDLRQWIVAQVLRGHPMERPRAAQPGPAGVK